MAMICNIEGCGRPVENHELGLCATHARQARKGNNPSQAKPRKKIRQYSDKKLEQINQYTRDKKEFFKNPENRICKVCGEGGADSIHHAKGKVGYADDWAAMNDIPLLLDQRFWIPIHSFRVNPKLGCTCHQWVEEHPEKAKELGLSQNRLSNEEEDE